MQLLRISLLVRDAFVPDHTVQTSVVDPDKTGSDPGNVWAPGSGSKHPGPQH